MHHTLGTGVNGGLNKRGHVTPYGIAFKRRSQWSQYKQTQALNCGHHIKPEQSKEICKWPQTWLRLWLLLWLQCMASALKDNTRIPGRSQKPLHARPHLPLVTAGERSRAVRSAGQSGHKGQSLKGWDVSDPFDPFLSIHSPSPTGPSDPLVDRVLGSAGSGVSVRRHGRFWEERDAGGYSLKL